MISSFVSGSSWLEWDSACRRLEDCEELVFQLILVAAVRDGLAAELVVPAIALGLLPSGCLVLDHGVCDPWSLANVRTRSCWLDEPV